MEKRGVTAILLCCMCLGVTLAQLETTYVTTPKVVEAKLGEHAEFSLTYTTPDNTSEFSVLRLGANGTDVVLRVVELNVTTNPNWTMSANVGVSVVGGDTRKVNITLYSVDYNVHEGEYIARVTGSDGDGQDFFKIRTLASPGKLQLSVERPSVSEGTAITFVCSGYTGRPRPVVHLLLQEVFNGTRERLLHPVLTESDPSVTMLENGTYTLSHNFTWITGWRDNFVEFRCDISYSVGLGIALSSARSDPITINVTSSKYTQIQVRPRIAEYGTQGLEIDCLLTRPETVTSVFFIQLSRGEPIKTEKKIVLVLGSGISWQTAGFQNRSTASGQLSPVASANLRFSIRNDSIQCPYDFSEYFCSSSFLTTTSGAVTENTNPAQVSYSVQPRTIQSPSIKVFGSAEVTTQREFRNGTTIQLTCTGQIGSNTNSIIRWCVKTAGSSTFFGLPDTAVHSGAVLGAGCQHTRSSTITYNVTSSDTYTEFLCESGFTSLCNSGTAKQFVSIKLESPATTPVMTTTEGVTTVLPTTSVTRGNVVTPRGQTTDDSSNTPLIAGVVVGSLVVLILIVLVLVYFLVIRRKKEEP
ncbi:uncharacterized protein LOC111124395 isoform X5 [Crassostrea virginica]